MSRKILTIAVGVLIILFFTFWKQKMHGPTPYNDDELRAAVADQNLRLERLAEAQRQQAKKLEELGRDDDSRHLALMASLMNENMAAIQFRRPDDIIYIERNWRIRRVPKYLDLTPEDVKWFEQFLTKPE